jgi:hypothetical protein
MRRFLMSLAVGLAGLALAGPAQADKHDDYKEYLKQLKEQQKHQDESFRKQQKRYEKQWREQQEQEDKFYREQAKWERESRKGKGKHRPFGYGDDFPGQDLYPPYRLGPIGSWPYYPESGYFFPGHGSGRPDWQPYYPPLQHPPSGSRLPYPVPDPRYPVPDYEDD